MSKRTALANARIAKGLNQAELGALVGLSQSGISRLEAGEFIPAADVARELIAQLGVTLDDVLGDPPQTAEEPAAADADPRPSEVG